MAYQMWVDVLSQIADFDWVADWTEGVLNGKKQCYLFISGPPESGKSMFVEAMDILFPKEVIKADILMCPGSIWNNYLRDVKIAYLEETKYPKPRELKRLKSWVADDTLTIDEMMKVPEVIPNSISWVQIADSADECPNWSCFRTETKLIKTLIPKKLMHQTLLAERDAFLEYLKG